ncbi:MAG: VOC family protein [Sphingomonadaceae bacterium]|nr:VOC family protein [Sphingomonadaceae bacterium]
MALLKFIDHVAITVADVERSTKFYTALFGAELLFDHAPNGRCLVRSVQIGGGVQLNIHQEGNGMDLVAARPTPGSADICFRFGGSIDEAEDLLRSHDIEIIEGPSARTDNQGGAAQSVYFLDPDGNLLELMASD